MSEWTTLVGTLGGVAVGGVSAWLLERSRWKRAQASRFDDERRRLYADFLRRAERVTRTGKRVAHLHGGLQNVPVDDSRRGELDDALMELREAEEALGELTWDIEVIGFDARPAARNVVAASRPMYTAYARLYDREGIAEASVYLNEKESEYEAAVSEFQRAARAELGLG